MTARVTATRYHDFSAGHRVYGHESKCAHLHGHNYRVHFTIEAPELDEVGRVMDFGAIKSHLCEWLEREWDHRMLLWWTDPLATHTQLLDPQGVVLLPFNPTAENMALYLLNVIGPRVLPPSVRLVNVVIEETRKCRVEVAL